MTSISESVAEKDFQGFLVFRRKDGRFCFRAVELDLTDVDALNATLRKSSVVLNKIKLLGGDLCENEDPDCPLSFIHSAFHEELPEDLKARITAAKNETENRSENKTA